MAKTITKKMGKKIELETDKYPMNIPPETLSAWAQNRRKGDPEEIMKALKRSRPIVERALNFGHVKEAWIIPAINDFYTKRLKKEIKQTQELLDLTKEANQSKKATTNKK